MFAREHGRSQADFVAKPEVRGRDEGHIQAFQKAQQVLRENALTPEQFVGFYEPESLARDAIEVEKMKRKFAAGDLEKPESAIAREKATILQAMIHEYGARWLGDERIIFSRTTEFDDFDRGIDEIVSFPRDPGHTHVGLSVDVTFAKDLETKVKKILLSIREDNLSTAKYFAAPGFRGELTVPKIIIGANGGLVDQMQRLWMKPHVGLSQHPFRHYFLQEALFQADMFLEYARRLHKPQATKAYEEALYCLDQRQKAVGNPSEEIVDEIKHDPMVRRLKGTIHSFMK